MKKKILTVLSYMAVAVAAVALTLCFTAKPAHYTKLEELADLLEQRFIDGVDRTKMEDAAADAMINSLATAGAIISRPANMPTMWLRRKMPMWVSVLPFPKKNMVISSRK